MLSQQQAQCIIIAEPDAVQRDQIAAALTSLEREVKFCEDVSEVAEQIASAGCALVVVGPSIARTGSLAEVMALKQGEAAPAVLVMVDQEASGRIDDALAAGAAVIVTPAPRLLLAQQAHRLIEARRFNRKAQAQALSSTPHDEDLSDFHALLQSTPVALCVVGEDGELLLWNRAFEALFTICAAHRRSGEPIYLHDCFGDQSLPGLSDGDVSFRDHEVSLREVDGTVRHFSISAAPLLKRSPEQNGIILAVSDISAFKQIEAAEREQRMFAEALRDTASALAQTLDLQSVMNLILDHVGRVVPHEKANIMLIDEDAARVVYSRGYEEWRQQEMHRIKFPLDMPTLNYMATTGKPIVIPDTRQATLWTQRDPTHWIRSYVATPIRAYNHVIGFLNLDSAQPGAFTHADAERLLAFANQAAIAIENAQLYSAIYRDAAELRALHRATAFLFNANLLASEDLKEVCDRIVNAILNEFVKVDCGVLLHEQDQLVCYASTVNYPLSPMKALAVEPSSAFHQVLASRNIIHRSDLEPLGRSEQGFRSQLIIPLRTMKDVCGVIDLRSEQPEAFDQNDQRILIAFAERAGAAIANMRLYNEIQRRVDERTAELSRVKERAEAILNYTSDSIVLLRVDGTFQQTNHAFNQMFGVLPDQLYGQRFDSIAGPYYAEMLARTLEDVIAERQPARLEIVAQRYDQSTFDADVVLSPIVVDNQVSSVICSLRDNSERKRLEVELRDALAKERELNELKSRFISRVSHEFRTPLAMIGTAADMLRNYNDRMTYEQRAEKLERLQSEVKHLADLLDDLLTLSKAEEIGREKFHPHPFDLGAMCAEVIAEMRDGIGMNHEFELTISGECQQIHADLKLLRRAIVNLLSNAVKYSLPGSKISLSLTCEAAQTIICVQDTGIGIPEEDQKHLFEAFYRARNVDHISGTGLGLAIVKQSVELHGGEITVSSQLGIGSAFTITLPHLAMKEETP